MAEVFGELGIKLGTVPTLYVDNTSGIKVRLSNIKSPVKNLGSEQYWVRHYTQQYKIGVIHKGGKINLADLFANFFDTGALSRLMPSVMGRFGPPTPKELGADPK